LIVKIVNVATLQIGGSRAKQRACLNAAYQMYVRQVYMCFQPWQKIV